MKTEKEFSDFFTACCQHNHVHDEFVCEVATHYWIDLSSHLNAYFSNEDRIAITKKAAILLGYNLTLMESQEAWTAVVRNFIEEQNWGFTTSNKKPVKKQTEEQKIFWQLFKYVWAFFQSMVILKIAVYYFGLESAEHPDQVSVIWVILFFLISAGSLALFAYRNRHDKG